MTIYVFSPSLEVLGVVGGFSALVHTRQFAGSGSFKLTAPFTQKLFSLLKDDNILFWEDAGRPRAVYIDSVVCETEKTGETITARGKNLRALVNRRIIWGNFNFDGTVEDLGRRAVNENAITPTDSSRVIPLLTMGTRKGLTQTITKATENENLEPFLDSLTATYGVGFDITLNKTTRKLIFAAYEGVDRRTTQDARPVVIVSRDRNNVVSEVYTRSSATARNTALVAGYTDEETGERREKSIVEGAGLSRREIFVKGSSSPPRWDEDAGETEKQALEKYDAELLQKGKEQLAEQVDTLSLEVELDPNAVAKLDVGDKVTAIESVYNLIEQTYISEITAYYEEGGVSYDVTLGDAVPSIYKKIEKELV